MRKVGEKKFRLLLSSLPSSFRVVARMDLWTLRSLASPFLRLTIKRRVFLFLFTRIFLVQRLNLLKIYYMLTTATETDDTSSIRIIRNEQIFRGLFCSFCGQVNTTSCCVVDSGARQQFGQILRIYSVYVYRV